MMLHQWLIRKLDIRRGLHTFLKLTLHHMLHLRSGDVDTDIFIVFSIRVGCSPDNVFHVVVGDTDKQILVRARVGDPQDLFFQELARLGIVAIVLKVTWRHFTALAVGVCRVPVGGGAKARDGVAKAGGVGAAKVTAGVE